MNHVDGSGTAGGGGGGGGPSPLLVTDVPLLVEDVVVPDEVDVEVVDTLLPLVVEVSPPVDVLVAPDELPNELPDELDVDVDVDVELVDVELVVDRPLLVAPLLVDVSPPVDDDDVDDDVPVPLLPDVDDVPPEVDVSPPVEVDVVVPPDDVSPPVEELLPPPVEVVTPLLDDVVLPPVEELLLPPVEVVTPPLVDVVLPPVDVDVVELLVDVLVVVDPPVEVDDVGVSPPVELDVVEVSPPVLVDEDDVDAGEPAMEPPPGKPPIPPPGKPPNPPELSEAMSNGGLPVAAATLSAAAPSPAIAGLASGRPVVATGAAGRMLGTDGFANVRSVGEPAAGVAPLNVGATKRAGMKPPPVMTEARSPCRAGGTNNSSASSIPARPLPPVSPKGNNARSTCSMPDTPVSSTANSVRIRPLCAMGAPSVVPSAAMVGKTP
jgi:hypothetical protein